MHLTTGKVTRMEEEKTGNMMENSYNIIFKEQKKNCAVDLLGLAKWNHQVGKLLAGCWAFWGFRL
jgi:hypothetical protein